ncbi:hypothetical protein AMS68_003946 [Peltaster fructicola]|uniref:Knr4/Smi1-like domain-containing protein n=1 Tax=Peltaster fructicola TaxID=286661 RepID=A0A6H0XUX4_9PEZI|nr:hypothetical protein AMS68_003946 [Peltaster fructicola]
MPQNALSSQWRAFWHTLTSNDRHASHDSPYRTGQHQPLSQNKHAPLNSGVPSASGSRVDLDAFDHDVEAGRGFNTNSNGGTPKASFSSASRQPTIDSKMDSVSIGEIQMQNFSDGQPPPPPVKHSWKRIDRFLEDNYEELFEQLGELATFNDVNELEHELDCTLPQDVRDSLQIHDGQERGGRPTGVVFGCMLLDCEEIIEEWQNWRTVNEAYFSTEQRYEVPQAPIKAFAGSSSAIPVAQPTTQSSQWKQELLDKQDSQPSGAVQKVYAHPAWIPLARDWGGNNICVDLAPGATGKWGQIILTGRDYDCKYVVARSWAHFLATLADDMESGRWWIDEESKELKLREFKQPGVEPAYIDILRWRADQKYGRKPQRRRSGGPLKINSQVPGGNFSPYQSPTTEDRGRSPHRLANGKAPAASSPRGHLSSPLARVAEESPLQTSGLKISTAVDTSTEGLIGLETPRSERLIGLESPIAEDEAGGRRPSFPRSRLSTVLTNEPDEQAPLNANGGKSEEGEMKTVEI